MKFTIFLLATVCCMLVHGRSLGSSHATRELLLKALSRGKIEDLSFKMPEIRPSVPQSGPYGNNGATQSGPDGNNEAIEEIRELLERISQILNEFKGDMDEGNDEEFQYEVNAIASSIEELEEKLSELKQNATLEPSLWDLYSKLHDIYGEEFVVAFWDEKNWEGIEQLKKRDGQMTNDVMLLPSSAQQLQTIAIAVEQINQMIDEIIDSETFLSRMVTNMIKALDVISSGSTTSGNSETTTTANSTESTTTDNYETLTNDYTTTVPPENPQSRKTELLLRRLEEYLYKG